jgi:hypothetical protein
MIRTLDVQQPFAQDPTEESTSHIVLLEDLGVVENVLDGHGVGDHDTGCLWCKRNVGRVIIGSGCARVVMVAGLTPKIPS